MTPVYRSAIDDIWGEESRGLASTVEGSACHSTVHLLPLINDWRTLNLTSFEPVFADADFWA